MVGLSFVSGTWGAILPHLYTGGIVTFLHPYTPESRAGRLTERPARAESYYN